MAQTVDPINVVHEGAIFVVDANRAWDPENPVPGNLKMTFNNGNDDWIDGIVESFYPENHVLWQSGRIAKGESREQNESMWNHRGKAIKIFRWAPGLFGLPGSGGGHALIQLPESGDVTITISVIG